MFKFSTNIKKDKLKKYQNFIFEKLNVDKIDLTKFNSIPKTHWTIYNDLKELSNKLKNEITIPFNKVINFGGIDINLSIIVSNRYYSNIDWYEFLNSKNNLKVEIPQEYDIDYAISLIIHEIRHLIDFTSEYSNIRISSFDLELQLRKYRDIVSFNEFYILFYISLQHELVARNNQIYPYIKFKGMKKEDSIKLIKKSFIWSYLENLTSFNHDSFIEKFEVDFLIELTNEFLKDVLFSDEVIEDYNDLKLFYEKFEKYFKALSIEWKDITFKEIDYVYEGNSLINEYFTLADIIKNHYKNIKLL
jgi:hypothetical protein